MYHIQYRYTNHTFWQTPGLIYIVYIYIHIDVSCVVVKPINHPQLKFIVGSTPMTRLRYRKTTASADFHSWNMSFYSPVKPF